MANNVCWHAEITNLPNAAGKFVAFGTTKCRAGWLINRRDCVLVQHGINAPWEKGTKWKRHQKPEPTWPAATKAKFWRKVSHCQIIPGHFVCFHLLAAQLAPLASSWSRVSAVSSQLPCRRWKIHFNKCQQKINANKSATSTNGVNSYFILWVQSTRSSRRTVRVEVQEGKDPKLSGPPNMKTNIMAFLLFDFLIFVLMPICPTLWPKKYMWLYFLDLGTDH